MKPLILIMAMVCAMPSCSKKPQSASLAPVSTLDTICADTLHTESTEKVGKGAILPFFLQITYGHSQLSIIGGECFFVVGGVRAFGGEALAQVVDFVVVLLKKKGGLFV